ncbi:protein SSX1-like [Erinaceus europaeus]|uniref:Protein SSX1-like n=1 Tax=Erinaceus europaeus TaxID=9365 RepID=A0ABM3WSY0_ERIEU|nr:protein SSX1-like [Erinaceus europaeus]
MPRTMNSTFKTGTQENNQKSNMHKCKAFMAISKYFSKKEWAKLGYTEKTTYVYMKRNYETMSALGLRATLPTFMCSGKPTTEFNGNNSVHDENLECENVHFLMKSYKKQRKCRKVLPKKPVNGKKDEKLGPVALGSEKTQKCRCPAKKVNAFGEQNKKATGLQKEKKTIWSCRLRERKTMVTYEEISDPEEED